MWINKLDKNPNISEGFKLAFNRYFGYYVEEWDKDDCGEDKLDWLLWCMLHGTASEMRVIMYDGIYNYICHLDEQFEQDFVRSIFDWVVTYKDSMTWRILSEDETIIAEYIMNRFPGRKWLGILDKNSESIEQSKNVTKLLSNIFQWEKNKIFDK